MLVINSNADMTAWCWHATEHKGVCLLRLKIQTAEAAVFLHVSLPFSMTTCHHCALQSAVKYLKSEYVCQGCSTAGLFNWWSVDCLRSPGSHPATIPPWLLLLQWLGTPDSPFPLQLLVPAPAPGDESVGRVLHAQKKRELDCPDSKRPGCLPMAKRVAILLALPVCMSSRPNLCAVREARRLRLFVLCVRWTYRKSWAARAACVGEEERWVVHMVVGGGAGPQDLLKLDALQNPCG